MTLRISVSWSTSPSTCGGIGARRHKRGGPSSRTTQARLCLPTCSSCRPSRSGSDVARDARAPPADRSRGRHGPSDGSLTAQQLRNALRTTRRPGIYCTTAIAPSRRSPPLSLRWTLSGPYGATIAPDGYLCSADIPCARARANFTPSARRPAHLRTHHLLSRYYDRQR